MHDIVHVYMYNNNLPLNNRQLEPMGKDLQMPSCSVDLQRKFGGSCLSLVGHFGQNSEKLFVALQANLGLQELAMIKWSPHQTMKMTISTVKMGLTSVRQTLEVTVEPRIVCH